MRTVRSAAWSRNRPRRRVAWLIVLVVLALIALAARVDAAPAADELDLAIRYADALTGSDVGVAGGIDGDDDEASEAAERAAEIEDDRNDGDGNDDDADAGAAGRDLAELAGELGGIDRTRGDAGDDPPDGPDDGAVRVAMTAGGPDALPADAGPGALAMRDAELDPRDPIAGTDAADAAAPAGAAEIYEQWMRHGRPSRWGRLDVGVALRSRWSEPMHSPPNHTGELWLVATWRR